MRKESDTPNYERYLFAVARWTKEELNTAMHTIDQWSARARKKGNLNEEAISKFRDWTWGQNQELVFCIHAYADIPIPTVFDRVFDVNNPEYSDYVPITIEQTLFNGTVPSNEIEHGHKSLNIMTFAGSIPNLILELPSDYDNKVVGICKQRDWKDIKNKLITKQ